MNEAKVTADEDQPTHAPHQRARTRRAQRAIDDGRPPWSEPGRLASAGWLTLAAAAVLLCGCELDGEADPAADQAVDAAIDQAVDAAIDRAVDAEVPCVAGEACTVGVGACAVDGVTECGPDGQRATCGASPGEAGVESCNGVDDDCDGATDEGVGLGAPCVVGVGGCAVEGIEVCAGLDGFTCPGEPGAPVEETCNGLDDDCDGLSDEALGVGEACTSSGVGACAVGGATRCGDDGSTACDAEEGSPSDESCNGVDDDCDGAVDEDLAAPLAELQDGVCAGALQVCAGVDGWATDYAAIDDYGPEDAVCDGIDNDCDGEADEALDFAADPLNCGGCGQRCAEAACIGGVCGVRCADGAECHMGDLCAGDRACLTHLHAPDVRARNYFGNSVAVLGDRLFASEFATDVVQIFGRQADGRYRWRETVQFDDIGGPIDAAGDRIVVSREFENREKGIAVAEIGPDGLYAEVAQIRAAPRCEAFSSIAIEGDVVVHGCGQENVVYVYERGEDGQWRQNGTLRGNNTEFGDWFGKAVDLLARPGGSPILFVGAPLEAGDADSTAEAPNNLLPHSGAIYAFEQDADGQWAQTAYMKARSAIPGSRLGWSLGVHGDLLVSSANTVAATEAYVFERGRAGIWSEQATLPYPDVHRNTEFGASAAVFGDRIAIAAAENGLVEVHERQRDGGWARSHTLEFHGTFLHDRRSVFLSDDTLVVGSSRDDGDAASTAAAPNRNAVDAGAVFIWTLH